MTDILAIRPRNVNMEAWQFVGQPQADWPDWLTGASSADDHTVNPPSPLIAGTPLAGSQGDPAWIAHVGDFLVYDQGDMRVMCIKHHHFLDCFEVIGQ